MSTQGEDQANGRSSEAWRSRVAADLAAYAAEQRQLYGGIDEMTLARYEAGVLPPEELKRVEQALRDHPALRECLEIAQSLDAEWQAAATPSTRMPRRLVLVAVAASILLALTVVYWKTRTGPPRPGLDRQDVVKKGQDHRKQPQPPGPENLPPRGNEPNPALVEKPPVKKEAVPEVVPTQVDPEAVLADVKALEARYPNAPLYPGRDRKIIKAVQRSVEVHGKLDGPARKQIDAFLPKVWNPDETMGILVPAYFDPTRPEGNTEWNRLNNGAKGIVSVPIIAIAKPDNGPGRKPIDEYKDVIAYSTDDDDKDHYLRVVGFIDCQGRDTEQIKADIQRWVSHYPEIRGFYFYSHEAIRSKKEVWKGIFEEARKAVALKGVTKDPIIISNPAGQWDDEFFDTAVPNILCLEKKRFSGETLPLWPIRHPSIALSAFFREHVVNDSQIIKEHLKTALARHIKWPYIGPVSTNALLNLFAEEVEEVRKVNTAIQDAVVNE